jgi:hypothetical protein
MIVWGLTVEEGQLRGLARFQSGIDKYRAAEIPGLETTQSRRLRPCNYPLPSIVSLQHLEMVKDGAEYSQIPYSF